MRFLRAGVRLIDAALDEKPTTARLRAFKFPAALEWLRIEDVIRLAQADGEADSKRAFRNRWATKDDFISDLCLFGLLYRDSGGRSAPQTVAQASEILLDGDELFSARVERFASALIAELISTPRSYLLAHIAPLLVAHPTLHEKLVAFVREDFETWSGIYREVLVLMHRDLRPGWTFTRLTLSLQALLDGIVLRHRIGAADIAADDADADASSTEWAAQACLALLVGAIDLDQSGLSTGDWIDRQLARPEPD